MKTFTTTPTGREHPETKLCEQQCFPCVQPQFSTHVGCCRDGQESASHCSNYWCHEDMKFLTFPSIGQRQKMLNCIKAWQHVLKKWWVLHTVFESHHRQTHQCSPGLSFGKNIFINELDEGIEDSQLPDNTRLGESANLLESRKDVQEDLDRLDQQAEASCMSVNKVKCMSCIWVTTTPCSTTTGGSGWKGTQHKMTWGADQQLLYVSQPS